MLENDILLRECSPLTAGVFMLQKGAFVIEGENVDKSGRCDNLSYSTLPVVHDTQYANEAHNITGRSGFSEYETAPKYVRRYERIIDGYPDFMIIYIEMIQQKSNGEILVVDIQQDPTPQMKWIGRSIYQLFKNMREWSLMIEDPFNSSHPMASYSKLALDFLNPPQNILDEIDSFPDSHLAKFLKSQSNWNLMTDPHPIMSKEFKNWIIEKTEEYPYISYEDRI